MLGFKQISLFINKIFKMKNILFITLLLFITIFGATAQKIKVLDKSDLEPIGQVNVTNATKSITKLLA